MHTLVIIKSIKNDVSPEFMESLFWNVRRYISERMEFSGKDFYGNPLWMHDVGVEVKPQRRIGVR